MNQGKTIADFPIVNKAVFMKEFDRINTCGLNREESFRVALQAEESRDFSPMINGVTVGLSTGTSGSRGLFLASDKERAAWVAAVLDRVVGFKFRKRKVAFFLRANSNLYESTQSKLLQFHFFDLFEDLNEHVKRLNELNPTIIVAQPSMLCLLAHQIESGMLHIKPEKVISVAEVLNQEDSAYLSHVFGQKIHQVYQCTEGFLATTCSEGNLHFNEDFLIIEKNYIDDEKTRFHPVITDLFRETQPVVRYELNDIVLESNEKCSCGSSFLRIEQIEGRSDDVLYFINKNGLEVRFFPDLIRRTIVLAHENITDYSFIQKSGTIAELYVQSNDSVVKNSVKQALYDLFRVHGIEDLRIIDTVESPFQLGNKKRRVKNESTKTH
jgi:putative adenylate-forming enzyme